LGSHDQRGGALIHHGTEASWIDNHLIATETIKKILDVIVVDKKGTLKRTA